jgi:hypothetical protein
MSLNPPRYSVAVFADYQDAELALNRLKTAGFPMHQVCAIALNGNQHGEIAGVDLISVRVGNKTNDGTPRNDFPVNTLERLVGFLVGGIIGLLIGHIIAPLIALLFIGIGGIFAIPASALVGCWIGLQNGIGISKGQTRIYSKRMSLADLLLVVYGTESEVRSAEAALSDYRV